MNTLLSELKRRNVLRVAALYLLGAWLIAQVTDVVIGLADWPPTVGRAVLLILACGFPVALVLAWIFEWTAAGLRRETAVASTSDGQHPGRQRIDYVIIAMLSVALVYFAATHDWQAPRAPVHASIAVLPFDNRSALAEDKVFADGIHDDLLTQLAKISSLLVIARTSVRQYRDSDKPIREIGRELGVATVLEGGVQRAGERVRINVQLIDANTDNHLWAETYDRPLTAENVFEIQSEIAKTIASTLQATLLPAETNRIDAIPTRNLDAYEQYLLGRREYAARDYNPLVDAERYFRAAIKLDSGFALAYTGLADTLSLLSDWEPMLREQRLAEAETAALSALQRQPELGEAHTSLGVVRRFRNLPLDTYEADLRRGVELAPGSADARKWYAGLLGQRKQYDAALAQLLKAVELDPLSPILHVNLGGVLDALGRNEEARIHYDKALEIDPGFLPALFSVIADGSPDEQLVFGTRAYTADSGNPLISFGIVLTYLDIGDVGRARQWQAVLRERASDSWPYFATQMIISVHEGQLDDAVDSAAGLLPYEDLALPIPSRVLALQDLRQDRADTAVTRYESRYPELFSDDPPIATHYIVATDVAMARLAAGDIDGGTQLLRQIRDHLASTGDPSDDYPELTLARVAALMGDDGAALSSLRTLVDRGWTWRWWYFLDIDPAFDSIRNEPRFIAMRAEVQHTTAQLLARVRELEAAGTISLPPDGANEASP